MRDMVKARFFVAFGKRIDELHQLRSKNFSGIDVVVGITDKFFKNGHVGQVDDAGVQGVLSQTFQYSWDVRLK